VSLALTFALAFAHTFASFVASASTFAVFAFALIAATFAFARGAKTRVLVLTIIDAVSMRYVHAYAVLIGTRHDWETVCAVLLHATLVEGSGEFF
jgi:hypothetical protein